MKIYIRYVDNRYIDILYTYMLKNVHTTHSTRRITMHYFCVVQRVVVHYRVLQCHAREKLHRMLHLCGLQFVAERCSVLQCLVRKKPHRKPDLCRVLPANKYFHSVASLRRELHCNTIQHTATHRNTS